MILDAYGKAQGACLLKPRAPPDDRPLAKSTNLFFASELYTVAPALWSLGGTSPGASAVVSMGNDSTARALTKGGPNHSLINHLVRALWFWPESPGSGLNHLVQLLVDQSPRRRANLWASGMSGSASRAAHQMLRAGTGIFRRRPRASGRSLP